MEPNVDEEDPLFSLTVSVFRDELEDALLMAELYDAGADPMNMYIDHLDAIIASKADENRIEYADEIMEDRREVERMIKEKLEEAGIKGCEVSISFLPRLFGIYIQMRVPKYGPTNLPHEFRGDVVVECYIRHNKFHENPSYPRSSASSLYALGIERRDKMLEICKLALLKLIEKMPKIREVAEREYVRYATEALRQTDDLFRFFIEDLTHKSG